MTKQGVFQGTGKRRWWLEQWLCEAVLGLRKLTLVTTGGRLMHRDVSRGPGVAGAALKGRVEVVNGFL